MSYTIDHVTRFVVRCLLDDCTWSQEHRTQESATTDAGRHVREWHDAALRCPQVLEYDDSIGGEGYIRCCASGEFDDGSTVWICTAGHTISSRDRTCRVRRCPCQHLEGA